MTGNAQLERALQQLEQEKRENAILRRMLEGAPEAQHAAPGYEFLTLAQESGSAQLRADGRLYLSAKTWTRDELACIVQWFDFNQRMQS